MFVTVEEEEEEEAAAKGASSINSQDPWLPFQSLSLSLDLDSTAAGGESAKRIKEGQEERQIKAEPRGETTKLGGRKIDFCFNTPTPTPIRSILCLSCCPTLVEMYS